MSCRSFNMIVRGLVVFLAAALPLYASKSFRFRQISRDEGLSQSTVYTMLQDRLGYMWFGTYDGLNRFDGHEFVTYKFRANDRGSLSNNRILCLYEDREGVLWIGTDGGGLNRFDRKTDRFTHYKRNDDGTGLSHNRIRAIFEDSYGNFWIGTGGGGLNLLNRQTGEVKVYRRASASSGGISHNRIRVIMQDQDGVVWVGTGGGGINRYNREDDTFTHYRHSAADEASLSDNQVNAIFEDRIGNLWVGTYSGGLSRMDKAAGTFVHYYHEPGDFHGLVSNNVNAIFEDRDGQLWIGTDKGLERFNWDSQTFVHYLHDEKDPHSLSDNEVLSLYQDRGGVFWVGTRAGGVNKFERGRQSFEHFQNQGDDLGVSDNRINALYEDQVGRLWVGTYGGGLDRFDPGTNRFVHYRYQPGKADSLSDDQVLAIKADGSGRLWVGTHGGGLNMTQASRAGSFQRYRNDPNDASSLPGNTVWSMLVDGRDDLWVGTDAGLARHIGDGRFVTYKKENHVPSSLSDNAIWCIFEDRDETLWIGTENGGLNRMTGESTFEFFMHDAGESSSLSHNTVLSIFQTRDGYLWIGTWGGGLNRLDPKSGEIRHFREADGLANDVVYGILADDRGRLWLSTNRGLSNFNPNTGAFRNYGTEDGLQGLEYNPGAYWRGQDGRMYFGGNNGFNTFHPDNFRQNRSPPGVVIKSFFKFDELMERDITGEVEYVLQHKENYLSFEFASLDFNNPEQNRYQYKMEGVDGDWTLDGRRKVTYRQLGPGDYVFRLKGSNNDNFWNEEEVRVKVRIVPPFTQTSWFIGLVVAGILLFLGGIFYIQQRRFKQEEAKALIDLELKRKTEELEEARRLQLSMLPMDIPAPPHLDIAVSMSPATEVGGDYYDFYDHADGTFTATIGDATGHGMKAGTLVAAAKGVFLSLVPQLNPSELLATASRILRSMGFRKMFMAMAVARFDGRVMTISVAGMPTTYIYRAATGQVEEIKVRGLPLGGVAFPYKESDYMLRDGDVVLLSSDGLSEMFNPQDQLLGDERVRETLRAVAHETPAQVIEVLMKLARDWAQGRIQDDDITLMVVKIKSDDVPSKS